MGHWGAILHSHDGGENWELQRVDTATDRPLFGVHFFDAEHGIAVGLWSLVLATSDGGKTWAETKLPSPPDGGKADRNLFGMFVAANDLYVAAERGAVLHSADRGATWNYLMTGYKGSLWAGAATPDGTLIVGGLRGTIFSSKDGGKSWKQAVADSKSSVTAVVYDNGKVIAVGLDGVVLQSGDQGLSFAKVQRDDRMALTAAVVSGNGVIQFTKHGVVKAAAQ